MTTADARSNTAGWTQRCTQRQDDGLPCGITYFVWSRELSDGKHRHTATIDDMRPHVHRMAAQ